MINMENKDEKFEVKINVKMIKELVSDKIYRSDASAFREQYVNALSHGCIAYHEEFGYTDEVYTKVIFDYGKRCVTIRDNGMGMTKNIFEDNFMSFGFSTVDKKTNNTRSGMFGLGAISFFRIATVCKVESWDRKTDEHFAFMTRNTDESEFITNKEIDSYGTQTEIYLKEHVKMESLIEMVRKIAVNYPVRTILEIVNAEQEQEITSYKMDDGDAYEDYPAQMRFKDFVSNMTNEKFTELINDDEMELYMSTTGGNKNHTYLCRVPIDVDYRTGFTTFLNIKKEKIVDSDSHGKEILREVPKPDRDEINEVATEYFEKKITKLIDEMIHDIDITSYDQYLKSDKRWILNGYSVDDKLSPLTHSFVQKLREPVRYRNSDGIQKRHESILTLLSTYKHLFIHPSLHKGTYVSIDAWHKQKAYKEMVANIKSDTTNPDIIKIEDVTKIENWHYDEVAFIDHVKGSLPITSAKSYKKLHTIPNVATDRTTTGSLKGLLVRNGSYNSHRIETSSIDNVKKQYPGGLYFGAGIIGQWNINNMNHGRSSDDNTFMARVYRQGRAGIVCAQTGKKVLPSILEWQQKMIKLSQEGKLISSKNGIIELEASTQGDRLFAGSPLDNRGVILLPLACKNIKFLDYLSREIVYMPKKEIYLTQLIVGAGTYTSSYNELKLFEILKNIKNWSNQDPKMIAHIMGKVGKMQRGYSNIPVKCLQDIVNYIIDLKVSDIEISEELYDSVIESIIETHNVPSYRINYSFKDMFPEKYLVSKAKELGYTEYTRVEDDVAKLNVYSDTMYDGLVTPIEIAGELYTTIKMDKEGLPQYRNEEGERQIDTSELSLLYWKPILDDDGNLIMVQTSTHFAHQVVRRNDKLQFCSQVDEWT